jgi:hypothetical protein
MMSAREHDEHVRVRGVGRTHGLDRVRPGGERPFAAACLSTLTGPECKVTRIHTYEYIFCE